MQEEIATVVRSEKGLVEVSTKIKSTCEHCDQSSHCGTGLLARYLAPKPENLRLSTKLNLSPRQRIKIGLPESLLLKLAFAVYVMPILILVLVASTASAFFLSLPEIGVVIISVIAVAGWFPLLRFAINRHVFHLEEPQIIQVFSDDETPVKFVASP